MRSYNAVDYGKQELRAMRKKSKQLRILRKGSHALSTNRQEGDYALGRKEGWDDRENYQNEGWDF